MVPFNVPPDGLGSVVNAFRSILTFNGSIVTVPHKQAILAFCDEVTPQARAVGAANVIRREPDGRIVGAQLDGIGFIRGLYHQGIELEGRSVHLSGAGGAASAIAFALGEAKVARLTLNNRSRDKLVAIRAKLQEMFPAVDVAIGTIDPRGHDIVVNGTTLGMRPADPLPIDETGLTADMVVAEVIMEPEITPLLAFAQTVGCKIHLGRHMLDHQLQLMADFLGL